MLVIYMYSTHADLLTHKLHRKRAGITNRKYLVRENDMKIRTHLFRLQTGNANGDFPAEMPAMRNSKVISSAKVAK